jgi:hypothetical protein
MARVCSGSELPSARPGAVYLLRTLGPQAHEVWDVTEPRAPEPVSTVRRGLKSTYRSWWECDTGIAYLISGDPMWRATRMLEVYDLSNPAQPVFIRSFGLPGQEPSASGPVPLAVLDVVSTGRQGNRVYLGYGQRRGGVLQILDRDKLLNGPKQTSPESLVYPEISRRELPPYATAHVLLPMLGIDIADFRHQAEGRTRDFIAITGRTVFKQCAEARQMVWFVDITAVAQPFGASTWTVQDASGRFCARGGRFGAYDSNQSAASVYYKRVMFFAHMNAGVRAVDVRNPFAPREAGHYIPAVTRRTTALESPLEIERLAGRSPASDRPVIQTAGVEVDERGYVYIVDRAHTGMHILELTGAARQIADWSKAAK